MRKSLRFAIIISTLIALPAPLLAAEKMLVVKGSVWDSDSRGFASIGGLSVEAGTKKAARRGARISLDGQPEIYDISGSGGSFELTFKPSEPSFRLVVEGDRFPRTITQPYLIPEDDEEFDIGRVNTPRAEGPEHSWPLPMVATALGYGSTSEMLADNKAAIRLLTYGSGSEGAPKWAYPMKLGFPGSAGGSSNTQPTSTSPFLMRVQQSEYVIPFDMNSQDTYFLPRTENTAAWIIIISFAPDEAPDKDVILSIEDTVTNELLDPPRPWKYSNQTIAVRNGYATELRVDADLDQ